jgi:hypothetical protein
MISLGARTAPLIADFKRWKRWQQVLAVIFGVVAFTHMFAEPPPAAAHVGDRVYFDAQEVLACWHISGFDASLDWTAREKAFCGWPNLHGSHGVVRKINQERYCVTVDDYDLAPGCHWFYRHSFMISKQQESSQ